MPPPLGRAIVGPILIAAVVGGAEVQREQLERFLHEQGIRRLRRPRRRFIEKQGLVIAMLALPAGDGVRRDVLGAEVNARHVVRRVDHEEQREGDEVDPQQDGDGVEDAADEVVKQLDNPGDGGATRFAENQRPP